MPRGGQALLLAVCFSDAWGLRNTFRLKPRLFEIGADAVFVELQANLSHGRLWSFVTLPGVALTVPELQAGVARLGPTTCWRLGDTISDEVQVYGHTDCGFAKGSTYALRVYVEAQGGTAFAQEFTVPPDPWPLPYGPYCFDLDIDYFNSTVEASTSGISDAEACQVLCQTSTTCLHFRYVYAADQAGHRNCSLLSWVRPVLPPMPALGMLVGPRSCETRSVNSFRPKAIIVLPEPPAARSVPFAMRVKGVNFMPDHDRVALVPPEQPCNTLNTRGQYLVNGSRPSDLEGWARLPCNGTAELPAEYSSLLVCGHPPETVVVEHAGRVKLCICDAGRTPYGCDHEGGNLSNFFERALQPHVDIAGPYPNQLRYCAASKLCYLEQISGYKLDLGDRMMLRENCTAQGPPLVLSYTEPSLPADRPFGLRFFWDEANTVVCPEGHRDGPCVVGRMCYCLASHGCTEDSDFGTDAGTVIFYGSPGPPDGIRVLQEDYRSFKLFWNYPEYDGGGPLRSYHLDIRTCPRGGLPDGPLANVTVLVEPGDNHRGLARNGTHQFRSISFGWHNVSVQPATRYCVRISARNDAGEGNKSQEFVWVTDVHPPTDLHFLESPLFLVQGVPMANLTPVVTTQDCRDLPSVLSSDRHVSPEDCNVQLYDVMPALPPGLSLDPVTGTISGTPEELSPRPQVYMITATNTGGKSSFYLSLATVDPLQQGSSTVAMCLSSPGVNDAIVTFQTGSGLGAGWYSRCAGHPQGLRLTSLDSAAVVFFQSSGDDLGTSIPRPEAVPCGRLVLDVWSSSPEGFPPPGLCFWDSTSVEVIIQGGQAFEANAWYQLVLKLRVAPLTPLGTQLLQLILLCSEASADEDAAASLHVGVWTPTTSLPLWRAQLSSVPPIPLATPVANAPWVTGRPFYVPGLANPLLGEAPAGEPFPWGFPAPGPVDCYNATSWCPTAPHQFVNSPSETAWYTDVDFPSFAIASSDAVLLTPVLSPMRFNPFGLFGVEALPRPEVALGQVRPLRVHQQDFTVDFALYPDSRGRVLLQRDLSICPSSPLQWPMLSRAPSCEVSSGPVYVQCSCSSTLPTSHPAARCDRVELHTSTQLDLRSQVTVTLKVVSGSEPSFAGFLPIRWYGEVKSQSGGLLSFHKDENAGLLVAPDLVLQQTTPEVCAEACLQLLAATVPCRSFKFHRHDSDCYLSQHVESEFVLLKRDWPADPYDNYEYQEQLVFSSLTLEYLSAPGVFFFNTSVLAETFLEPPPPSEPPFGVRHFFPSYTAQPHLVFALEVVAAVPIYGQDPWSSRVLFHPPNGFVPVALQAFPSSVPTPQGLGYCGNGNHCSWFLSWGQVLWQEAQYRFLLTTHNPQSAGEVGQRWTVQVESAGFNPGGPTTQGLPLEPLHPLPIEGRLQGCSAHLATAEETLDVFFVLRRPWDAGNTLQLLLPDTFSTVSACSVKPLTPWLSAAHMSCVGDGQSLLVRLDGPLRAGAAVGLRFLPLKLPSDFASVHPGSHAWPMITDEAVRPQSLNIRLQLLQPQQGGDACHPVAMSCGLDELGADMVVRPAREAFALLVVQVQHTEPMRMRGGWVQLVFALNTSLSFEGALDDALLVRPPHGYLLTSLHSADVRVTARDPRSGQLNLPTSMHLFDAVQAGSETFFVTEGDSSALQVRRLFGEFLAGEKYQLNLSFLFPASGSEPSLLHPTRPEPGHSACSHVWSVELESGGEPLASAFAAAAPLSFLAQFEAHCTTAALGADNVLMLHFATTPRSPPLDSQLVLVFSLPSHLELVEPTVASDFVPADATAFGSAGPEAQAFEQLGCPSLLAHSRGRLLRVELAECAVHFNDAQDVLELALVVDRLPAAAAHQLLLRVRNPATATATLAFSLSAFGTAKGRAFAQLPPEHSAEALGAQLRLQQPLRTTACGPLLPAMQAAVEASLCTLAGHATEVAISFVVPEVLRPPVRASVAAPAGYTISWTCNTSTGVLALPSGSGKSFEQLSEIAACDVSPSGRNASFTIAKTLKARSVWHVLSLHTLNPRVEEAPAAPQQHAWSLVVGNFAGIGLRAPPLRLIAELQLRELRNELHNGTGLTLRMRTAMAVPAGGYVLLHSPLAVHCESSSQPPLRGAGGTCFVETGGLLLGVALADALPAAAHELRFTAAEHAALPQEPLRWLVESWRPASATCQGSCCPELRPAFLNAGAQLELLERGVLETFPPGTLP